MGFLAFLLGFFWEQKSVALFWVEKIVVKTMGEVVGCDREYFHHIDFSTQIACQLEGMFV